MSDNKQESSVLKHDNADPDDSTEVAASAGEKAVWKQIAALVEHLYCNGDRVSRSVIDDCAEYGDTMIRALQDWFDAVSYESESFDGWWMTLHASMIAGLVPTQAAGQLLVKIMCMIEEEGDDNMFDWLSGYTPALFRNKPVKFDEPLREMAEDRGLGIYLRSQAAETRVSLARREGESALEQALDWLAGLSADEDEGLDCRFGFCQTLLDFPRDRYRPLLDDMAARQTGRVVHFNLSDITKAYNAGRDQPAWLRFENPWVFYDPANIRERQKRWAEEDRWEAERGLEETLNYESIDYPETYVRSGAKIGRNDPCPCGSGKKFKKCCLM